MRGITDIGGGTGRRPVPARGSAGPRTRRRWPGAGRLAVIVALLSLLAVPQPAAEASFLNQVSWGGRWELTATGTVYEDAAPEAAGKGTLRLQAQTRTFPWRGFLDARLILEGPLREGPRHRGTWKTTGQMDRLYVRRYLPSGQISLGKQFVNWGVGYAFAPTDVFNPPDPTDPEALRPGIVAAVGQFSVGPLDYWSMAVAKRKYGIRRRGNISGTDWSVLAVYDDGRTIIGADLDGDWGIGWHVAAAYHLPRSGSRGRLHGLVGADYSWLDGRLLWIGELAFHTGGEPAEPRPLQTFQQLTYRIDDFTSVWGSVFLADMKAGNALWTLGVRTMLDSVTELALIGTAYGGPWLRPGGQGAPALPGGAAPRPRAELKVQYARAF